MAKKFIGNVKGVGVASAIREYYSSTSATAVAGGTWQSTVPTLDSSHYLWTRLKLTLTNGKVEVTEAIREGMFGEEIENLVALQQSQGNKINTIAPNNVVDVAHGGTGTTTLNGIKTLLGLAQTAFVNLVTVALGGTGKSSHTANAVLTGNGTSAVNNVATANGALYATSANGAAIFGTLPVAQGGTGSTSASGARTNLGLDGKLFTQYALNSINIDSTGGNWTVDISESGHGTIPTTWVNVTQTTGAHFIVQTAKKCDLSSSATGRDQRMWVRDKYSSGVWSNWREVLTEGRGIQMVKLWENGNPSSSFAAQNISVSTNYDFVMIAFLMSEGVESTETIRVKVGGGGFLLAGDAYVREFGIQNGQIQFSDAWNRETGSGSSTNKYCVPVAIYGIKGVL